MQNHTDQCVWYAGMQMQMQSSRWRVHAHTNHAMHSDSDRHYLNKWTLAASNYTSSALIWCCVCVGLFRDRFRLHTMKREREKKMHNSLPAVSEQIYLIWICSKIKMHFSWLQSHCECVRKTEIFRPCPTHCVQTTSWLIVFSSSLTSLSSIQHQNATIEQWAPGDWYVFDEKENISQ